MFQDFGAIAANDANDSQESGELGIGEITVNLYADTNNNGSFDRGTDQLSNTVESNSDTADTVPDGSFRFIVADGTYFVEVDTASQELEALLYGGTTNPIKVVVAGGEQTADFPFDPALQVVKTVSAATASAGDEITYTITLENKSTELLESVAVYEFLPTSDSSIQNPATRFSYVPNSTTVLPSNSVALKSNEPDVELGASEDPYSSEDNREQLFWELDDDLPAAGKVEFSFRATIGTNVPDNTYANDLRALYTLGNDIVVNTIDTAPVTLGANLKADVLLVKRITAINGDRLKNPNDNKPLNTFVDDTVSTRKDNDNHPNWKSNYLLGELNAGKVKPGDEIEYTIYFLNAGGSDAENVRVCDRINENVDFKFDAYGTDKEVQLQLGNSSILDLTSDDDSNDRTQLISAGASVPNSCYLKQANDNGVLLVDITGNAGTGEPNLTSLPASTGEGTPNNSYGFFRFVVKVKP